MANRIKGITVKINGDTTNLSDSLAGLDKDIKNTQSQLKDVEKLLKFDPTNTELLAQKQRLLGDAISDTERSSWNFENRQWKSRPDQRQLWWLES